MSYRFSQPLQLGELPPAAVPTIHSALPRLDSVDAKMEAHKGSAEGKAVLDASKALALCAKVCREQLGRSARNIFSNFRDEIEGAAKVYEESTPKNGAVAGGYKDRQSVIDAQVSETETRFAVEAWRRAVEEQKELVQKLGTSAQNAMLRAKRAIDSGLARYQGPLSFRDEKFSMDDAAKVGEAREEARNMLPSRLHATLEALIEAGDLDQEMLFVMAVKPVLAEDCSLPYVRLKERFGAQIYVNQRPIAGNAPDTDERKEAIETERAWAMKALERIEQRAVELTPQSLLDAKLAYAELVSIFGVLLGWHARVLGAEEYAVRYKSGAKTDVLDLYPAWATRLGVALSGAR